MSFEENTVDPQYKRVLVFRLGGQYRECILVELAWMMGLYEQHEALSPLFDIFLRAVARDYSERDNN